MITKVTIENFKRFAREEFVLDRLVVLAGPNNSGKSTLLQALSTWSMALDRWRLAKGEVAKSRARRSAASRRSGLALTRRDFSALPLREFGLLWHQTETAMSKSEVVVGQKPGEPRLIHITVEGSDGLTRNNPWSLTMELRYQSTEQLYIKPVGVDFAALPTGAAQLQILHCPPFSGIGAEERRMDLGAQQLEIGQGKPGNILRNLMLEVSQGSEWDRLVEDIQELFRVTLLKPDYEPTQPFIICEYLDGIPKANRRNGIVRYDIASGGSGFHQALLLLSFFYARPSGVLLLDEPDAHLHVNLQHQVYDRLKSVAARRQCQLIVATHSEVILEATEPTNVVSFLGKPHRLESEQQRKRVALAMSRLTTLDLLLAEQGRAVLYAEGATDFRLLHAWSRVLKHRSLDFFRDPFFHSIGGSKPQEAKAHLHALRAIHPQMRGLLLLDKDNRDVPPHDLRVDGLEVVRWERYEIENYLLVPDALMQFACRGFDGSLAAQAHDRVMQYLRSQFPPSFFEDPLSDKIKTVSNVRASKDLLPDLFAQVGMKIEKSEYYQIAELMQPKQIHPDVIHVLDRVAGLLP